MSDLNNQNEEIVNEEVIEVSNSSTVGKMVNIILAPSKALKAIKEKPNVLLPMLLVIILPVLYYIGFWTTIEIQMIKQLEDAFALQGLETTREMLDELLVFAKWGTPIGISVMLIFSGVISATYYYICSKIAKKDMSFKQTVSLIFHVMIISSLSWILFMILTSFGIEFAMDVPMTSLASLFPSSMAGTFLFGLAMPVEIFSIWGSVITYFGLRIIGEMSHKASIISVVLAFVFGMLLNGGTMLLTSLVNTLS